MWRNQLEGDCDTGSTETYMLVQQGILNQLESLTLFEDPNDAFMAAIAEHVGLQQIISMGVYGLNHSPARGLFMTSLSLRHLSVSFSVTAEDFFTVGPVNYAWWFLRSLALRSCSLTSNGAAPCSAWNLTSLPLIVFTRMPVLETLVLWWSTGEGRDACALIYERKSRNMGTLTWRGTGRPPRWFGELVTHWATLGAQMSPGYFLSVSVEKINGSRIYGLGDALHKLRLPVEVINPMSLRQMRQEKALEILSTPGVSLSHLV
ncbi:hypothetical protein B0J18DRAFT_485484 [Chaetomium sp. MPI-SDFR-AT-0129]|nr:hypothetical protein B0J18DRAFT_485484 [Chaetomium sp. MPI-SDFR-AT-0129]